MAKSQKNSRRRRAARVRHIIFVVIVLALVGLIAFVLFQNPQLIGTLNPLATPTPTPTATPSPTPLPTNTPEPTQTVAKTSAPTATPTPTPTPQPRGEQEIDVAALDAAVNPNRDGVDMKYKIYANGERTDAFQRNESIRLTDPSVYTELEGVTTFRSNNFRDSASYGVVPTDAGSMAIRYYFDIGTIDNWSGVGWTGQPAIVRWPEETLKNMNVYSEKKAKDDLVEVIYGTMDGKIYFFDLEDGTFTRDPIDTGAPIRGSVTIDPRGYPLLYVGQGISEIGGEYVAIGLHIYSLIDQSELFFLDGNDTFATRGWYAADGSPLVDEATDTVVWASENGLLYTIALNSVYDETVGTVSVTPTVDRFWYESEVTTRPGMENSVAIYNHYAYFADNSGLITCLDLNSMTPVWSFDAGDDTDATLVLEEQPDGDVYLYTGCELDLSGQNGQGSVYLRCLNALTGKEVWNREITVNDNSGMGGVYATPALGQNSVDDLVFFAVARTQTEEGERLNMLCALDKLSGEVVWEISTGGYCWSSPTLAYDSNGRAYLFQNNSNGDLKMIDAKNGTILANIDLGSNVEGSPAIYNDMLVIGTRGQKIYGIVIN